MTLPKRTDCEGFHRRDFLQIGAASVLGLSLPGVLAAEAQARASGRRPGKAQSVILLWLAGGPATIDMWDNKPEAPEGIRGEFKNIATTVPGLFLSEPLPKTAQIAHKLTIVRSLHHTIPSHGPASLFMTTGNKPTAALQYPSFGSLMAKLLPVPRGVPPYVTFGGNPSTNFGTAGYLGTSYNPFFIEGNGVGRGEKGTGGSFSVRGLTLRGTVTLEDLEKRDQLLRQFDSTFAAYDRSSELLSGLDTFHQQALDILRSDRTRTALDLSREKDSIRQTYGNTPFGQGALAARRLIEAGVRFATVTFGGWDTHNQNFTRLKNNLLPVLDTVLSALVNDLEQRGLLESTIVMVAGEFNRTPRINRNAGRDHWARSMAVVLAGGGFPRGYVHGSTDASGMAPATDPCTPDDLGATIFTLLGIDPHLELTTPTGRPMQLFREGRPIEKLL